MFSIIGSFIKKTDLKSLTKMLTLNVLIGLTLVGGIVIIALMGAKNDHDSNQQIEVSEALNDMQNLYQTEMKGGVERLSKREVEQIKNSALLSKNMWDEYIKMRDTDKTFIIVKLVNKIYYEFFLTIRERAQIEIIQNKKRAVEKDITNKISALTETLLSIKDKSIPKDSEEMRKIDATSQEIIASLSELTEIGIDMFSSKKKMTDSMYKITITMLLILMLAIIAITLLITNYIIKNIGDIMHTLEDAVSKRTQELKTLNENLEKSIAYEVEENRKKDHIMYQQARFASMGEMMQNISHQWRQPLNSMMMLIQSLKLKSQNNTLDSDFVNMQVTNGLRIAKNMSDTIESFRSFFTPMKDKSRFSAKSCIEKTLEIISPSMKSGKISIKLKDGEDFWIAGHENMLSQVVMILINNSKDASENANKNSFVVDIYISEDRDSEGGSFLKIRFEDNCGGVKDEYFEIGRAHV